MTDQQNPPCWPEYTVPLAPDFEWTPIDQTSPIAYVQLKRGRTVNQWLVLRCPYCGEEHYHGAGSIKDDPRKFLGGRVSHCWDNEVETGEYRLVEWSGQALDSKRTIKLARAFRESRSQNKSGRLPIPREIRAAIWQKTKGRCWYCGNQTNPFDDFHVDHIHPVAKGGQNDLDNLVPCCQNCNLAKKAMSITRFKQLRGGKAFWFEVEGME